MYNELDFEGVLVNNRVLFCLRNNSVDAFRLMGKMLFLLVVSQKTDIEMKSLTYEGFVFLDYHDLLKGVVSYIQNVLYVRKIKSSISNTPLTPM